MSTLCLRLRPRPKTGLPRDSFLHTGPGYRLAVLAHRQDSELYIVPGRFGTQKRAESGHIG